MRTTLKRLLLGLCVSLILVGSGVVVSGMPSHDGEILLWPYDGILLPPIGERSRKAIGAG